ncbi:uncharacterized protein [Argopecten irradians]|uniref:uncharacterized protein n=1 Tax=Argopecten irradians TaxID=31199 RepID=UPI0037139B38
MCHKTQRNTNNSLYTETTQITEPGTQKTNTNKYWTQEKLTNTTTNTDWDTQKQHKYQNYTTHTKTHNQPTEDNKNNSDCTQTNTNSGGYPCDFNLVTGPYGVSDEAFSASSTHNTCPMERVRFTSPHGWCPNPNGVGHFIQVEFKTRSTLTAIQTRGRGYHNQWVSSYIVNISMDGTNWRSILSNGDVKVFPGNWDSNTTVTNTLEKSVDARFIRIISVTGPGHSSMRLEVKGCPIGNCMSSTFFKWKKILGSTGDVFPVLEEINVVNQGLCGLMCYRQPDCDSFVFDIGSNHCWLLKSTPDALYTTVDFANVWYFTKP